MEDGESSSIDGLLEELGGCGLFQIVLVLIINLSSIPNTFGNLVDNFGTYNPGWRCLDNGTKTTGAAGHGVPNTTSSPTSATFANGTDEMSWNSAATFFTTFSTQSFVNRTQDMWNTTFSSTPSPPNVTTTLNMTSSTSSSSSGEDYTVGSCELYHSCQHVEFNPDSVTYVTQWGLLCDKGWILSTMLSVRMAGYMLSTFLAGYIGDRYGRRFPYLATFILRSVLVNTAAIFSVSWQMYTVMLFLHGCLGCFEILGSILAFEYVAKSWRVRVGAIPTWSLGSILFSVTAMLTRDWRYLRVVVAVVAVGAAFPLLWIPRSLRFLSANEKGDEILKVVRKIAWWNKKDVPESVQTQGMKCFVNTVAMEMVERDEQQQSKTSKTKNMNKNIGDIGGKGGEVGGGGGGCGGGRGGGDRQQHRDLVQTKPHTTKDHTTKDQNPEGAKSKSYTILSLFRKKGYLLPSLAIGFVSMSMDLLYFALNLSVIALPGNLYTNMMISATTELPGNLVSFFVASVCKRKPTVMITFFLVAVCMFGIMTLDLLEPFGSDVRHVGTVSLIMVSKFLLYIGWITLTTSIVELYPTVVRSTVRSYMIFASGIGGIVAPYLIPTDPDTFYVSYLVMGVLLSLSTAVTICIPETKDIVLADDWDDDDDDDDKDNDDDKDDDNKDDDDDRGNVHGCRSYINRL